MRCERIRAGHGEVPESIGWKYKSINSEQALVAELGTRGVACRPLETKQLSLHSNQTDKTSEYSSTGVQRSNLDPPKVKKQV